MKTIELARNSAICSMALLLANGVVQAQTVYKSVDEDGTVVFTDRPVSGQLLEALDDVEIAVTDTDAVDADKAAFAEQAKYAAVADDIGDNQSQEDAEIKAALADQRAAACRAATARLEKYAKARRLYRELPDGEREYLNSAELESERADAAQAVDELCS
jgi:hypothetical protein